MIQQAKDFRKESDALFQLLEAISTKDFQRKTQFKEWTIHDVIGHLHVWNWAADLSLNDDNAFQKFLTSWTENLNSGSTHRDFVKKRLKGIKGRQLLKEWHTFFPEMSKRFETADQKTRVNWVGPDMSVLSCITGRLMETWAHGQELYDLLGVVRENKDRIKNIAVLGVNTFDWTFANRKMDLPTDKPYVELTAPSGEIWEWNDPSEDNKIKGMAVEFCQVVTQVRNIKDTSLYVIGETANQWMSIAQCFAGQPETPPKPGSRYVS